MVYIDFLASEAWCNTDSSFAGPLHLFAGQLRFLKSLRDNLWGVRQSNAELQGWSKFVDVCSLFSKISLQFRTQYIIGYIACLASGAWCDIGSLFAGPQCRDRRHQIFGTDTDTDTLDASEPIQGLIPRLRIAPNRYWDWYQYWEKPSIDTDTDTDTRPPIDTETDTDTFTT